MNSLPDFEKFITEIVLKILELMGIGEYKPELKISHISNQPETTRAYLNIEINFQDNLTSSLLIGRNGNTLQSLNIILQSIINNKFKDQTTPRISLDINSYYAQQEEGIETLVNEAIKTIQETHEPYKLNPMPARVRRIVHLFLADNPEFESVSEGEGSNRQIVIKPKSYPI